jgi:hypothetical protein
MTQTRIRLARAELYEKVWAAPVRTLAKEFGMSDVGLAKICRKHDIPIPPLGYWRKRETGHNALRPPLPPAKNSLETLDIYVRERLPPELAALAAEPAVEVAIPADLSHELVTRTEKLLASGKENEKKLIVPKNGTLSHLLVSRDQMSRALKIINALFLALEERGQSVSWPKEEEAALTLAVDGETVTFCVLEITESLRHVLTLEEQKRPWMAPKWDYKLTGKLQFRVENLPYSSGVRGTWSDGKCQRLEKCIGDFIVCLRVAAAAIKKNRQETEERERQWEEERKQQEERRRKAAEHKRKAEFITELMRNWEEAQNVRTFAKALAECAGKLELSDEEKNEIQQVVDWTTEYAEFLDPLSDLTDSIAEFIHPERRYPWLNV